MFNSYKKAIIIHTMVAAKIWVLVCWLIVAKADEAFMNTAEILDHRKIAYEKHQVVTEDGYILTLFRIPHKERKGVVVLQHSLSLDSAIFLVSEKRSIAMDTFSDGYEIWLPNFRGLPFSDQHKNPDMNKLEYWNFSFHEIGYYDQSAVLGYISNFTSSKLIVINHSLSSTASLIFASLKPEEAEKSVKVFVNIASSAFMNNSKSPFKQFTGLQTNLIQPIMDLFEIGAIHYDFYQLENVNKRLALLLIPRDIFVSLAEIVLDFLFGKGGMKIDPDEFPMILSLGTQAVASKIMSHYAQLIESGRFCMFDYGADENIRRYNSSEPPDYPLEAIRVPVFIVLSDGDTMSDQWGSNKLYDKLPAVAKKYGKMEISNINHAGYLIGQNRFEYFEKILQFIGTLE